MTNPNDSPNQTPTTTTTQAASTPSVSGRASTPTVAGEGTSSTTAPPRRSITRPPPTVAGEGNSNQHPTTTQASSGRAPTPTVAGEGTSSTTVPPRRSITRPTTQASTPTVSGQAMAGEGTSSSTTVPPRRSITMPPARHFVRDAPFAHSGAGVGSHAPKPTMGGEGTSSSTTAAATVTTTAPPRRSITMPPPTVVAADSSVARHFVRSGPFGEPYGAGVGSGSGSGGAVAVSAGMAVLQIGPSSARVKAGIGSRGRRGGGRIGQRKRNREQGDAAGGSGGEQQPVPLEGQFICPVCRRNDFPSFQSLTGHMKAHPDRTWRGMKPPPVFGPDEFRGVLPQGDAVNFNVLESSEGQGGNLAVPGFDQNRQPAKEEEPSSSSSRKLLDLNRTPSPED